MGWQKGASPSASWASSLHPLSDVDMTQRIQQRRKQVYTILRDYRGNGCGADDLFVFLFRERGLA